MSAFLWDDPDQDQWLEITRIMVKSNEPMNPLWTRIRQFIWSTMVREISHHWSWSESSQRNASISLQNYKRPSDTVCGPWSAKVRDALGPRHFRKSNISSRKKKIGWIMKDIVIYSWIYWLAFFLMTKFRLSWCGWKREIKVCWQVG